MILTLSKHFPIIQILLPFFGALFTIFTSRHILIARIITIISILAALTISLYGFTITNNEQISYTFGNWLPQVGIEYQLNPLNQTIIIYLNFVLLFFLVFCHKITKDTILKFIEARRRSIFYSVLLFAHVGYLGMVSTNDFFNLYVFIEISSLSSYVLMAQGDNPRAVIGAFDYLIMGSIGATLILISIGFILSVTGNLNMQAVAVNIHEYSNSRLVISSISFFLIGAILKTAFFPMHFWMIRAYSSTAPIILVYLASISTIIGMYLIFKFSYLILANETIASSIRYFIKPIALLTIMIAPYFAYKAKYFKTIIIYSAITQVGYAFLLYITKNGLEILPSFLIVDSLNKIALFLLAAYYETYKTKIYNKISWRSIVIIVIICSCGLPISPLFIIKVNILSILLKQNLLLDFIAILISSVASLFYHYKMIKIIFWTKNTI